MLDIMDMLDTHTPMDTMERDLLMLSQRLMLIPISCTEDMALAMPDIMDMLDTHTPMDTTERDLLMLSQRLMLMLLSSTELTDMVLDTEPTDMDTHMPMVPTDTTKRSADAEPKADADAAYLYGGYYGYARPYAYGYRSYGYPYWGYVLHSLQEQYK